MLERFTVDGWVNAVKTHGIKRSGVQPAVIRMLLDADVPKEDLASLEFPDQRIGSARPGDPRRVRETTSTFRSGWPTGQPNSLAHCARGHPTTSTNSANPNATALAGPCPTPAVRIVDADSGAELPTGEQGLLEARVAPISADWIRTTDIASIDADGFVTLHGRADGAINRGGFKILPETVRRVLISHPAVRDACVVGVPDERLGQVPFAAIEATPGMPAPSDDELKDLVRQSLPVYNVPVAFAVVDELPRNPALKVSLPEVAALYDAR